MEEGAGETERFQMKEIQQFDEVNQLFRQMFARLEVSEMKKSPLLADEIGNLEKENLELKAEVRVLENIVQGRHLGYSYAWSANW